jgi:hypothetical protein
MIPCCNFRSILMVVASLLLVPALAHSQSITIDGVTDRSTYNNSVQLRVQTNAGFSYLVTLNGKPITPGIFHTINVMDYYDLLVARTNDTTSAVTNALVRFIVLSSQRGSPELGLVQWVPLPPIPSTAAEMAGARMHLMMPQTYPAGLEIPVVVRVEDSAGNPRRVNGWVNSTGIVADAYRVVRGEGHGFLPASAAGNVSYAATLQSLETNKVLTVEASTTWTTVSGVLAGTTTWADNSRIHVTGNLTIPSGATLTIGAGTVVRLNAGVNITNTGRTLINGTIAQPVVFTPTNRVAPEQRTGAWGGWIMRGGELVATAAIMTGSGAAGSFSFSPGSSHRSEQALLFMHNSVVRMTNCALINNAGQVGNGYFSSITWDHCLVQRAITVGEYERCTNIINHSALIEFPSIDGVYSAAIADADFDGFYTISSTNFFANTLFGFCKDDAIDSGSGGAGTVVLTNCWVESALHEALAWSGEGRRTWTYDSVLMNSGQGIECGWSTGADSPLCYASNLLSTGNSVGARYGDNYTGTTGLGLKTGFLTVTNSFILNNYRDVWGQVWDNTWNYRVARMDIQGNYLTAPNTNHPNNTVWDPATHAALLAPLMQSPPEAAVGIGFANWDPLTLPALTNGVPVRLSTFTTNQVTVNYLVQTPSATIASGTLTFQPGETVKRIVSPITGLTTQDIVRVALEAPVNGEITTASQILLLPANSVVPTNVALIPFSSTWKYLDTGVDQMTAWRDPLFNDASWPMGCAEFGYGDGGECTTNSFGPSSSSKYITTYYRKAFTVEDPLGFTSLSMRLLRDDGGVVYLNGTDVYRSPSMPQPPTPIVFATLATNQSVANAPADNTVDVATLNASLLVSGTNVMAVEIHQHRGDSSDISFNFELLGNLSGTRPRLNMLSFGSELVLYWSDPAYLLEASSDPAPGGGWAVVPDAASPVTVSPSLPQRFFRLKKP